MGLPPLPFPEALPAPASPVEVFGTPSARLQRPSPKPVSPAQPWAPGVCSPPRGVAPLDTQMPQPDTQDSPWAFSLSLDPAPSLQLPLTPLTSSHPPTASPLAFPTSPVPQPCPPPDDLAPDSRPHLLLYSSGASSSATWRCSFSPSLEVTPRFPRLFPHARIHS